MDQYASHGVHYLYFKYARQALKSLLEKKTWFVNKRWSPEGKE